MTTWGYLDAIGARNTRVTLVLDTPAETLLAVANGATAWLYAYTGVGDGFVTLNGYDADGKQRCELSIPLAHVLAIVKSPSEPSEP